MTIRFECGNCRKPLNAPDDKAGAKSTCPNCRCPVTVPTAAARELPPPAAARPTPPAPPPIPSARPAPPPLPPAAKPTPVPHAAPEPLDFLPTDFVPVEKPVVRPPRPAAAVAVSAVAGNVRGWIARQSAGATPKPPARVPVPQRLPAGVAHEGIRFEVPARYRGGHPGHPESRGGRMVLTDDGIYFVATDETGDIVGEFARVSHFGGLRVGAFPPEMVERARRNKRNSKVGGQLARLTGSLIGGKGGAAIKLAGGAGAMLGSAVNELGAPPRNRLTVRLAEGSASYSLVFDIEGASRAEIERRANELIAFVATIRRHFRGTEQTSTRASGDATSVGPGRMLPAMPMDQIVEAFRAGRVSETDLVRVESWVSVGTLLQMLGVMPSAGGVGFEPGGSSGHRAGFPDLGDLVEGLADGRRSAPTGRGPSARSNAIGAGYDDGRATDSEGGIDDPDEDADDDIDGDVDDAIDDAGDTDDSGDSDDD